MMEDLVSIAPGKKKVVRYHELRECKVGCCALVWPIDHPAIPVGAYGHTTAVQSFDRQNGVAETVNTRYEPGPFAQWFEKEDETPFGQNNDSNTMIRSTPMQFRAKVKSVG
jgi:hypothetical protein